MKNKNLLTAIAVLVLSVVVAFSFYNYGKSQVKTNIVYKEVKASKKQIDSLKATLKPNEKKVVEYKQRKEKAKSEEKSITYNKEECKEIVENLKQQIADCDTVVKYQDKIVFVDKEIIKEQEILIDKLVVPKKRPWGIGVQGGYGTNGKDLQPYIGVGISYNLIRF